MNTNFAIEDLRGNKNSPADFRVVYKDYFLLFNITNNNELVLIKVDGVNTSTFNVRIEIPSKLFGFYVTEIGDYALGVDSLFSESSQKCICIEEIIMPSCLKKIGVGVFKNCGNVSKPLKVEIPDGVSEIGSEAFYGSGIARLFIPASVSIIGKDAFAQTNRLVSIEVDEENECFDSRENSNSIIQTANNRMIAACKTTTFPTSVTEFAVSFRGNKNLVHYIVPSLKKKINSDDFYDCINLNDIIIPDSIVSIDSYAFYNCRKLKSVKLPNSVKEIGDRAFANCDELTSIVIPCSITHIGEGVFENCQRLNFIAVDERNNVYDSRNDSNAIIETATNTLIQGCAFTVIPKTVTRIGKHAFGGCYFLKSIELPTSVKEIADSAFENCRNLETIIIPDSVKTIGYKAFEGCTSLREILVNDVSLLKNALVPERTIVLGNNTSFEGACLGRTRNITLDTTSDRKFKNKQGSPIIKCWIGDAYDGMSNGYGSELVYDDTLYSHKYNILFADCDWSTRFFSMRRDFQFDDIIDKTMDIIRKGEMKSFNEAFFDSMEYFISFFFDQKYIKFINIFNNTEENQFGHIGFYADFFHSVCGIKKLGKNKKLITTKRAEVDLGKNNCLFGGPTVLTIEQLFRKEGHFGKMFEYCCDFSKPLIADEHSYFAIRNDAENEYIYNLRLGVLIHEKDKNQWQDKIDKFDNWLANIDTCYGSDEGDMTNYYFYISNSDKTDVDKEREKYCICANIGIVKWETDSFVKNHIVPFLREFRRFIDQLSFCLYREIDKHILHRAAVVGSMGKVMSRNMSHNIGSHVLSNLINRDVYERLADNVVLQSNSYQSCFGNLYLSQSNETKENTNLQLPFFIQYLKSRMDYLSEVTFGVPNMLTTKYMYNDVFKELDRVRVLLNYISGIPDFKYTFSFKYNGVDLTEKNDIAIAFSSDILGAQAFYNILENIIRNTAKHSCLRGQTVVFKIEFTDIEKFPSYYCVEIDNGIEEEDIDNLVIKQNQLIKESVLDENNNLRDHGLGLLEMATSAAFLRQVDIAKVDSYEYRFDGNEGNNNLNLLKAINKSKALGYRFFMQKPKEFLLVGDWNDVTGSKKRELVNMGIHFVDDKALISSLNKRVSFAQQFLLYKGDVSQETKNKMVDNDTLLPLRRLELSSEEVKVVLDIINNDEVKYIVDELKDFSWTKYYNDFLFTDLNNNKNHNIKIRTGVEFDIQENGFISNQVIFLHHGTKNNHNRSWAACRERDDHDDFEVWIENLSSRTSSKLPEFNSVSGGGENPVSDYCDRIRLNMKENAKKEREKRKADKEKEKLEIENMKENRIRYSIFEAYHNKVLAMDERIQKYSKEKYEGSNKTDDGGLIPCSDLFKSTNVIIPETPLDPNTFTEEARKELEHFVDEQIQGAFLLIHYSILERLYKNKKVITDKLNKWAKKAKRVVVTSGRGAHSLPLPPTVCFADLSSVLYAFVENRNKITINDLLNQSRRKHE